MSAPATSRATSRAAPRALFDPAELTAAERDWLVRIHAYRHYRTRGGYKAVGDTKICSLDMAMRLRMRGVVRHEAAGNGPPMLASTGLGNQIVAILAERANRRARA